MAGGRVPCVVMPGLDSFEEAFWLRDVLTEGERSLGVREGEVRVLVSIETLQAAFDVDEILFAVRERAVGLRLVPDAVRFSMVKVWRAHPERYFPDRGAATDDLAGLRERIEIARARRGVGGMGRAADAPPESPAQLLGVAAGPRTVEGFRRDVRDAVEALASARTEGTTVSAEAERARALVWHRVRHQTRLDDGRTAGLELLTEALQGVVAELAGDDGVEAAARCFRDLTLSRLLVPHAG